MSPKSILVLALIFSTQLLISCIFNPCDCDPGITRSVNYTKGDVIPLDTSGFGTEVVVDTTHRNSFGLVYQGGFEETQVSEVLQPSPIGSFGFSAAFACSCIGDTYVYNDPVTDLSIVIINYETGTETDGNLAFGLGYSESHTLENVNWEVHFNQEWYPDSYFSFELTDEDAVAPSTVFRIVLTLESGATLTSETDVIYFFD